MVIGWSWTQQIVLFLHLMLLHRIVYDGVEFIFVPLVSVAICIYENHFSKFNNHACVDRWSCLLFCLFARATHTHVNILHSHTLGSIFIPIYFVISKNKIEIFTVCPFPFDSRSHSIVRGLFVINEHEWNTHIHTPFRSGDDSTKKNSFALRYSRPSYNVIASCLCVYACAPNVGALWKEKWITTHNAGIFLFQLN